MADWQRTLDLTPEWGRALDEEITIEQMARVTADRLEALEPFGGDGVLDYERTDLAEQFRAVSDVEDFDGAMEELYDWADTRLDDGFPGKKACWVKTTF